MTTTRATFGHSWALVVQWYGSVKVNRDVRQTDECQLRVVQNGSLDRDQRRSDDASSSDEVSRKYKGKAKGKGEAKGKKSKKGKPKDYDKDLFSTSKDEDVFDPEERVGAAIALPNVLPLPGFLVAALMEGILRLAAIKAIRKRANKAG